MSDPLCGDHIPLAVRQVGNAGIDTRFIGICAHCMEGHYPVATQMQNAGSLPLAARIHRGRERLTIVAGNGDTVIKACTCGDLLVPYDYNNIAVFYLTDAPLTACYTIAGEFHANRIIVSGLALIVAAQQTTAVAAADFHR